MSKLLDKASAISVAATFVVALFSANGSGAAAQVQVPHQAPAQVARIIEPAPVFVAQPVVQPLSESAQTAQSDQAAPESAATLAEMVASNADVEDLPGDLKCLAGAIYFEAKGESLAGQLAVGRVVVNRSKSGRFPDSYCGVVYQPSQFSFVRGKAMPPINTRSIDWREAVAIARIAHAGSWQSPVEGALFFHATHVSPRWRLTRMARVDGHVFYR